MLWPQWQTGTVHSKVVQRNDPSDTSQLLESDRNRGKHSAQTGSNCRLRPHRKSAEKDLWRWCSLWGLKVGAQTGPWNQEEFKVQQEPPETQSWPLTSEHFLTLLRWKDESFLHFLQNESWRDGDQLSVRSTNTDESLRSTWSFTNSTSVRREDLILHHAVNPSVRVWTPTLRLWSRCWMSLMNFESDLVFVFTLFKTWSINVILITYAHSINDNKCILLLPVSRGRKNGAGASLSSRWESRVILEQQLCRRPTPLVQFSALDGSTLWMWRSLLGKYDHVTLVQLFAHVMGSGLSDLLRLWFSASRNTSLILHHSGSNKPQHGTEHTKTELKTKRRKIKHDM